MIDYSKLPPHIKKDLAKHLFLKDKALKAKALEYWEPWVCRHGGIHTSQRAAFMSQARRRLVLGGNRSGKSELGEADTAHMFLGTHPFRENRIPCIIKMLCEDFTTALAKTILPKLMKFIPPSSISSLKKNERGVIVQIAGVNNSVIDFMSYDQDPRKFESFEADVAWFDEPPPQEIYEAVRRGLIDREGTELFTMTPLREPWIYNTLYLPGMAGELTSTEIFELRTACNPYISLKEIEEIKEVYSEETLSSRLEGKFKHLVGMVYPQFDRGFHIKKMFEWPPDWPVWMCLDPHPKKPHAVLWVGVTPNDTLIVLDELKAATNFDQLAVQIKTLESNRRYRVIDRLCDTSIRAMDRQDQLILLANAGIRCRFPHKNDRRIPGIEKVQQRFSIQTDHEGNKFADLYIRENCKMLIKEISSYVWDQTGEAPKKVDDDLCDDLRYIVDVDPRFNFTTQPTSYVGGFGAYGGR